MKRLSHFWAAFLFGALLIFSVQTAFAQNARTDTVLLNAVVEGKDTIPLIYLPEVVVSDRMSRKMRKEVRRYNRLRNAVYVTYPYAVAASRILNDVNDHLKTLATKREKKDYLKKKEQELKDEFGDKLENLSVYQGKVLIKLISRETGDDCYNLIRQMRGGFSARFWQTVAFFFGSNLKTAYSVQEDQEIEAFVKEIEYRRNIYYYNHPGKYY